MTKLVFMALVFGLSPVDKPDPGHPCSYGIETSIEQAPIPEAVVWFKATGGVFNASWEWAADPSYPAFYNGVITHNWNNERFSWIEAGPNAQPFVYYRIRLWMTYPDGFACPAAVAFFKIQD